MNSWGAGIWGEVLFRCREVCKAHGKVNARERMELGLVETNYLYFNIKKWKTALYII